MMTGIGGRGAVGEGMRKSEGGKGKGEEGSEKQRGGRRGQ